MQSAATARLLDEAFNAEREIAGVRRGVGARRGGVCVPDEWQTTGSGTQHSASSMPQECRRPCAIAPSGVASPEARTRASEEPVNELLMT
jgi:hypothetical protein